MQGIQGENRDGFYVQPLMKRIWAVQLDILKIVDTICKNHNLKYYAWYGTLLGAVRNHGFIPWDDDMDLAMIREDYEKFQHLSESELPDGWKILKVSPTLIRILNTDIIRLDQEFLDKSHGCPFIIGVDIFCLDYIPQDKQEEQLWLNLFWASINLYEHWNLFRGDTEWENGKWDQLKNIEELTGYHFDTQSSILEQLYEITDKIAAMYWDSGSDEITVVSSLYHNNAYRIPRSHFDRIIDVTFENTTIPVLADYDLLCKLSYGKDYMTPIKSFVHSDIEKQISLLREHFKKQGKVLPECFDMEFKK